MTEKRTIGELIEKEVRRQQLSIVEFADKICCKRNNVYNLFTRNNMDIKQLALISKVLGRNFFKELAEDLELANETDESEEDIQNRKAVSQFMEVAPRVLRKLNASPIIVFSVSENGKYEGSPVPDFMLPDYAISFTIGETFQERAKDFYHPRLISIESFQNKEGIAIEISTNHLHDSRIINIKLDYKSEAEWYDTLKFALEVYNSFRK